MTQYAPEIAHERLLQSAPRRLRFRPESNYAAWRSQVAAKLRELVGGGDEEPCPLDVRVEYAREQDGYRETRFVFSSEPGADVPCHLLTPLEGRPPFPTVICLQGHSTGMHVSLGINRYEEDARSLEGDRDYAIQAVRRGYAALALEQRCFGERRDARLREVRHVDHGCHHASMVALLLGRSMVAERCLDVSRAIDALEQFPEADRGRLGCMGNSGGGTITYFATCLEPRIGAAMPSCYVCSFLRSIGRIDHCADNYVPGFLRYFDLQDIACLIAPRPLVVVAGREDPIFPIQGVEEAFATIRAIYATVGAPDRCALVVGEGAHRFFADQAWPVYRRVTGW